MIRNSNKIGSASNINALFITALSEMQANGVTVVGRQEQTVKELHPFILELKDPSRNILLLPQRKNNFIATLVECIWVFAGQDDISMLSAYLPRANEFSDDGRTWRGAYGPRLLKKLELVRLVSMLNEDPTTRRAVLTIYNNEADLGTTSLDIPCNVMLHPYRYQGVLDLEVYVRSNDLIWGFAINTFEWTMLQCLMAKILGAPIGVYYHYVSSLHVYQRHWERMKLMLAAVRKWGLAPIYPEAVSAMGTFDATPFGNISSLFQHIWEVHRYIAARSSRSNARDIVDRIHKSVPVAYRTSPFAGGLYLIEAWHCAKAGDWEASRLLLKYYRDGWGITDWYVATVELITRTDRVQVDGLLPGCPLLIHYISHAMSKEEL